MASTRTLGHETPRLLRAIMAGALLVKGHREYCSGIPANHFLPHALEVHLISHHIQYFSASCLPPHEVHITLTLQ